MTFPICAVHRLGLVAYEQAWELQEQWAGEIARGECLPSLLLLEHPHTYTFGRMGKPENLLWDENELARRGIAVHWVDRGGDVTYHGPGQLVGYPLIPLQTPGNQLTESSRRIPRADYIGYLRRLEAMLIEALAGFNLHAERQEGMTGVWVHAPGTAPAKIASIGVKVDARGITRHGFALNVSPDMSYWDGIIACGLAGSQMTSLASFCTPTPGMNQVMQTVVDCFSAQFGCEMVED